jgi:asparagine synthase (glutamine-hydrolysing)
VGFHIKKESGLYEEAIYEWETCGQSNLIDKTLQFYTNLYLQNNILAKIDRASMLNSLEVRSPFLDIRIIDFIRKIPYQFKYRNGQTKYILIKALEPILPRNILHRAKKGFGIPVGKWFQQDKLRLPCNRINMDFKMNESFLEKIIHDHLHRKTDQRLFLWNLWLLLNGNFTSSQIIR